ncbi:MAG: hypothetical protein HY791_10270 [Deltaproteobacteria bacterium]|nr:hypothetical protein [Deltaproteobacteria bacterium]
MIYPQFVSSWEARLSLLLSQLTLDLPFRRSALSELYELATFELTGPDRDGAVGPWDHQAFQDAVESLLAQLDEAVSIVWAIAGRLAELSQSIGEDGQIVMRCFEALAHTDVWPQTMRERLHRIHSEPSKTDGSRELIECGVVFGTFGRALRTIPELVPSMLKSQTKPFVLVAIRQTDPEVATTFHDELASIEIEWVQRLSDRHRLRAERDRRVVKTKLAFLKRALAEVGNASSGGPEFCADFYGKNMGWNAARALAQLGARARMVPEMGPLVVPCLLRLSTSSRVGQRGAAAFALGPCGVGGEHEPAVIARLIDLTHDHPWVAGRAIDSLALVPAQESVLKRLGELLFEFEEFDPDEAYLGQHARITRALCAFGARAESAIPDLLKFVAASVESKDEIEPGNIIRALVRMSSNRAVLTAALTQLRGLNSSDSACTAEIVTVLGAIPGPG